MMRITVVLEYPSEADVPRIGINTTDFGIGKVCAVQFSDALAELEQLHDSAAPQHESQWQPDTIKIPRPEGHDSWSIEIKTSYGGGGGVGAKVGNYVGGGGGGSYPDTGETTS